MLSDNKINNPATLRAEVHYLMIDLGIYHRRDRVSKLAAVISQKLGKKVSRGNLAMSLTGYRETPAYIEYLKTLKTHLEDCLQAGKDPVTIYTDNQGSQGDTQHHMSAQG